MNKIKCNILSLSDEIEANSLDRMVLTYHFAVINKCFSVALGHFAALKDDALANKDRVITAEEFDKADTELDGVRSMLNEFRCYALARIHFLSARKDRTIVFANWVGSEDKRIQDHRADTTKKCKAN
jgi:hypothetical protein